MNNPEKRTCNIGYTRRRKTKTQHNMTVLDTTMRKQTQIRHEPFYKQKVKTNRTSFLCENRNGHITTRNSKRKDT